MPSFVVSASAVQGRKMRKKTDINSVRNSSKNSPVYHSGVSVRDAPTAEFTNAVAVFRNVPMQPAVFNGFGQ
jgi:hypothetical protein